MLALAINRYIIEKEITDYDKLKHYKTLLTVVYFLNQKYTAAYNSSIDYFSYDNQAVIYYILGILRQQRGDYSSAVSMLTLAVKNGYNHYDAFLQRAVCYGHEKQYNLSNADLDTCIMIDSGYYPFYLKGVNYNHLRDYSKAMLCLDYSLYLNDTFADSYNYRGIVYSHTGRYAFAVKDFQRAAALNPKTRFVYNNLGLTLEKTGNITEAVHYYKKATKTDPDLPDAYYNLGRIYILLKDYDKALSYLKKSLARDASLPDTYYLAGISYQGKNDKVKACDMYNKALEKGHTLAQEKIDDYCNKEDTAEDKDGENLDKQEFILPEVQYED